VGGAADTCDAIVTGGETITFDKMIISVYDSENDDEPIAEPDETDCTDFSYTIPRLERGSYFVTIEAMATDDDGDYLPYYKGSGKVVSPQPEDDEYIFTLLQNKGKLTVTWGFDNYGQCAANGVKEVEMTLLNDPIDCELGEYVFDELDWTSYSVEVDGIDGSDNVTWRGAYENNPFEVKPGTAIEVLVILEPAK
jgi:hypothetical protein